MHIAVHNDLANFAPILNIGWINFDKAKEGWVGVKEKEMKGKERNERQRGPSQRQRNPTSEMEGIVYPDYRLAQVKTTLGNL